MNCLNQDWSPCTDCNYLNELPDDILVEILSRLNVKEAARTSVVSRRWRNLCTHSTTYEAISPSFLRQYDEYKSGGAMVVRYRKRVNLMDHAILAFDTDQHGDPYDYSELNKLILNRLPYEANVTFWPWISTLSLPRNATLTALYLNSVKVFGHHLEKLLNLCPNLETLSVENLPVHRFVVESHVGRDALNLKHLEIRYCKHLQRILIYSAPNLVSLKLATEGGTLETRVFGQLPKLSSISLEGTLDLDMLWKIQPRAPLVERLELNMDLIRLMSPTPYLQCLEFSTVRTLKLVFDFSHEANLMNLAVFIEACPSLEKLTLMYGLRKGKTFGWENVNDDHKHIQTPMRRSYRHQCLKVVEFLGWCGHENEVRFASFVIDIASHLEDLVFYPFTPLHLDKPGARTFEQADSRDEKAIASARQLIDKLKMIKSWRPWFSM